MVAVWYSCCSACALTPRLDHRRLAVAEGQIDRQEEGAQQAAAAVVVVAPPLCRSITMSEIAMPRHEYICRYVCPGVPTTTKKSKVTEV